MSTNETGLSLEEFARWLARVRKAPASEMPTPTLLEAARRARDEHVANVSEATVELWAHSNRLALVEDIELLAAAEGDESQLLPRMRTPNGFAISPIYRLGATPGEAPAYLLVECPADLIEVIAGETAYFFVAGERIELGKFDSEGKASGPLPAGTVMKPPFAFSVGTFNELPKPEPE